MILQKSLTQGALSLLCLKAWRQNRWFLILRHLILRYTDSLKLSHLKGRFPYD